MLKVLLLTSLSTVYLFAQTLSLDDALSLLKVQNLEVKAAQYDVHSANLSSDIATAQHYGRLDFTQNMMRTNDAGNAFGFKLSSREASFGDFGFSDFDPSNPNILSLKPHDLNYPAHQNFFQSKLSYELPLYTGNKISAYETMAKEMKRIASLEKEDQINTKIYEVRKSYYDMGLLEGSVTNLSAIHSNIMQLESMTKEMIQEGYAKKIDLLEVQSKKANVARIITELQANQELLYHYLSFLLNQEVNLIQTPQNDLPEPNLSGEDILHNNLDIKKAMTALKVRENMLLAEKSRYLPTVGARVELQTADDTFLGDANDHASYTLGVQLKWNLFAGGEDNAAIEKARMLHLKMQTQSELAKQGIALKVKEIQTNIKSANSEIKSLTLELSLARQIYANYEDRYKEQLASMNDVIIKQSSWLEKVLQLLKAKNTRNTQIFALERLGTLSQGNK